MKNSPFKIKLPDFRCQIALGISFFLAFFLYPFIQILKMVYTGNLMGNSPENVTFFLTLLSVIILLFLTAITVVLTGTNELVVDDEKITFRKRVLFKTIGWSSSRLNFTAVEKKMRLISYRDRETGKTRTRRVHAVRLVNRDKTKSIYIFQSKWEKRARKKWEQYSELLQLPAIERSSYEDYLRNPEDLNRSISERLKAGTLTVDDSALSIEPETVSITDEGDSFTVKSNLIVGKPIKFFLPLMLAVLCIALFPLTGVISDNDTKWIVGLFSGGGALFSIIFTILYSDEILRKREVLKVNRKRIIHCFESRIGIHTFVKNLKMKEIEHIGIVKGKEMEIQALFIDSDRKKLFTFRDNSANDQKLILNKLLHLVERG